VNCHRAHVVGLSGATILPYLEWARCNSTSPSFRNFATGVSGVIYPPRLLDAVRDAGEGFRSCTLRNDDVWLHVIALRSRMRVRQVDTVPRLFLTVPSTQSLALDSANLLASGNDVFIGQTYVQSDIALLLDSEK